jgi:hypothetical protein
VREGVRVRWQLCTDAVVDLLHSVEPVVWSQDAKEVDVGQAALLERHMKRANPKTPYLVLDDPDVPDYLAEHASLDDVVEKKVLLDLEDPGDEVGAVLGCLARHQLLLELWAVGVEGVRQEEIGLLELPDDGHAVLVAEIPLPPPSLKAGAEDDLLADPLPLLPGCVPLCHQVP